MMLKVGYNYILKDKILILKNLIIILTDFWKSKRT